MDTFLESLDSIPILNVRESTLNGRRYIVANVTLLKQGVLNGSKGKLYYPFEEIAKNPGMWNGIPLTANHPMNGDRPVSARQPEVWQKYHLGFVFNDTIDATNNKRDAEVWVDVNVANKVDNRIVPAILAGKPINVSTGLFTSDEKVTNQTYNSQEYTHIARNYKSDHLAILMDDKGACSVKDGCGINLNTLDSTKDTINCVEVYNRDWPKSKRDELDKSDFAGPHESYPIKSQADVDAAAKLVGHADNPDAVKARIKEIAKRKGLKLPESWTTNVGKYANAPEKCVHCGAMHETDPDSGVCNRCGKQNPAHNILIEPLSTNTTHTLFSPEEYMRDQLVSWLTTNCGCWKGKEELLKNDKNFSDKELETLKSNAETLTLTTNSLKEIAVTLNAPKDVKISDLNTLVKNATSMPAKTGATEQDGDEYEADGKTPKKKKVAMNAEEFKTNMLTTLKGLSDKEYLDNAPPGINSLVTEAKGIVEQKRIVTINALTKHITDDTARKAKILQLKDQPIATLNLMMELQSVTVTDNAQTDNDKFLANFFGAAGAVGKSKQTPTYNRNDILKPNLYSAGQDYVDTETEVA